MKKTSDSNGQDVEVGSKVRVLAIDENTIDSLPQDERKMVASMVNEVLTIYEIDEYGRAWVEKVWDQGDGKFESHSLGLESEHMELVP